MVFEIYGTATVIGKKEERGLFNSKYVVAYEAIVDGQRVTGTKKVKFDEYSKLEIGNSIDVRLFSGDGRKVTPSRIDAGLESVIGAFVHPSLERSE